MYERILIALKVSANNIVADDDAFAHKISVPFYWNITSNGAPFIQRSWFPRRKYSGSDEEPDFAIIFPDL